MYKNNSAKTESSKEPEQYQMIPSDKTEKKGIGVFVKKWWPIILLLILFCWAGKARFVMPNPDEYSIVVALIKAAGLLAIIFYVIYTKDLTSSSIQTAQANVVLAQSTFSNVEAVIEPRDIGLEDIDDDCRELSRCINVDDGKLSEDEFKAIINQGRTRVLCLKVHCMGVRSVKVTKVAYEVKSFGCKKKHAQVLELKDVCIVDPSVPNYINLVLSPKGLVYLKIISVDFIDAHITRTRKLNKDYEDRLPETSGD